MHLVHLDMSAEAMSMSLREFFQWGYQVASDPFVDLRNLALHMRRPNMQLKQWQSSGHFPTASAELSEHLPQAVDEKLKRCVRLLYPCRIC